MVDNPYSLWSTFSMTVCYKCIRILFYSPQFPISRRKWSCCQKPYTSKDSKWTSSFFKIWIIWRQKPLFHSKFLINYIHKSVQNVTINYLPVILLRNWTSTVKTLFNFPPNYFKYKSYLMFSVLHITQKINSRTRLAIKSHFKRLKFNLNVKKNSLLTLNYNPIVL